MKKKNIQLCFIAIFIMIILFAGTWVIRNNFLTCNAPPDQDSQLSLDPSFSEPAPSAESPKPPEKNHRQANIPIESQSLPDLNHLRLVGIVGAENKPYAIIKNEKTKKQDLYTFGDMIDAARICEIQSDRVILEINGISATLILETTTNKNNDIPPPEISDNPDRVLSITSEIDIEKAWDETQQLMIQIELGQHMENNEKKGVIVQNVVKDSIFEKIGFLPGDIILKVDDMDIEIEDDAMEIYNCLRTKDKVQFTIIRNGAPANLEYTD